MRVTQHTNEKIEETESKHNSLFFSGLAEATGGLAGLGTGRFSLVELRAVSAAVC